MGAEVTHSARRQRAPCSATHHFPSSRLTVSAKHAQCFKSRAGFLDRLRQAFDETCQQTALAPKPAYTRA